MASSKDEGGVEDSPPEPKGEEDIQTSTLAMKNRHEKEQGGSYFALLKAYIDLKNRYQEQSKLCQVLQRKLHNVSKGNDQTYVLVRELLRLLEKVGFDNEEMEKSQSATDEPNPEVTELKAQIKKLVYQYSKLKQNHPEMKQSAKSHKSSQTDLQIEWQDVSQKNVIDFRNCVRELGMDVVVQKNEERKMNIIIKDVTKLRNFLFQGSKTRGSIQKEDGTSETDHSLTCDVLKAEREKNSALRLKVIQQAEEIELLKMTNASCSVPDRSLENERLTEKRTKEFTVEMVKLSKLLQQQVSEQRRIIINLTTDFGHLKPGYALRKDGQLCSETEFKPKDIVQMCKADNKYKDVTSADQVNDKIPEKITSLDNIQHSSLHDSEATQLSVQKNTDQNICIPQNAPHWQPVHKHKKPGLPSKVPCEKTKLVAAPVHLQQPRSHTGIPCGTASASSRPSLTPRSETVLENVLPVSKSEHSPANTQTLVSSNFERRDCSDIALTTTQDAIMFSTDRTGSLPVKETRPETGGEELTLHNKMQSSFGISRSLESDQKYSEVGKNFHVSPAGGFTSSSHGADRITQSFHCPQLRDPSLVSQDPHGVVSSPSKTLSQESVAQQTTSANAFGANAMILQSDRDKYTRQEDPPSARWPPLPSSSLHGQSAHGTAAQGAKNAGGPDVRFGLLQEAKHAASVHKSGYHDPNSPIRHPQQSRSLGYSDSCTTSVPSEELNARGTCPKTTETSKKKQNFIEASVQKAFDKVQGFVLGYPSSSDFSVPPSSMGSFVVVQPEYRNISPSTTSSFTSGLSSNAGQRTTCPPATGTGSQGVLPCPPLATGFQHSNTAPAHLATPQEIYSTPRGPCSDAVRFPYPSTASLTTPLMPQASFRQANNQGTVSVVPSTHTNLHTSTTPNSYTLPLQSNLSPTHSIGVTPSAPPMTPEMHQSYQSYSDPSSSSMPSWSQPNTQTHGNISLPADRSLDSDIFVLGSEDEDEFVQVQHADSNRHVCPVCGEEFSTMIEKFIIHVQNHFET